MNIKFDLAKIRLEDYEFGTIELLFCNQNNQILYFNGACFYYVDNEFNSGDHWNDFKLKGEIVGVRQTSDFIQILKLADGTIIRILTVDDKYYPNGIAQKVIVSKIDDFCYKSDLDDFENQSEELEIGVEFKQK